MRKGKAGVELVENIPLRPIEMQWQSPRLCIANVDTETLLPIMRQAIKPAP